MADLIEYYDSAFEGEVIDDILTSSRAHQRDTSVHVTSTEKATWNAKAGQNVIDALYSKIDNITDDVSYLKSDKADKSQLDGYLPKSGGNIGTYQDKWIHLSDTGISVCDWSAELDEYSVNIDADAIRLYDNGESNKSCIITYDDVVIKEDDVVVKKLSECQKTLVSGTSIKTINNQSLLGSGNISIDPLDSLPMQYKFLVGQIVTIERSGTQMTKQYLGYIPVGYKIKVAYRSHTGTLDFGYDYLEIWYSNTESTGGGPAQGCYEYFDVEGTVGKFASVYISDSLLQSHECRVELQVTLIPN